MEIGPYGNVALMADNELTRQDKTAPKFLDRLRRDFTASAPNVKWCDDMTEIQADEGKLYLATVNTHAPRQTQSAP
jgi:putative transposase